MEFMKHIKFDKNPTANQSVTIHYSGFLKNSPELSIVYGFDESWKNTTELKMEKIADGFTAELNILDFGTFHFCFKDSNNTWDNNSNCNYIAEILPYKKETVEEFNIDALIEQLLEPIMSKSTQNIEDSTPLEIHNQSIDLGYEITRILSEIDYESSSQELVEYSSLDEILCGTVINETTLTSLEESPTELFDNELKESTTVEVSEELGLTTTKDSFIVSSRQLSQFYLFRKRIKLAFYKALIKIPKLIFGSEEQ